MQDAKNRRTVQVLEDFHTGLSCHFRALHEERSLLSPAAPVFALEHDLGDADLDLLKNAVRDAVRQGFGATFRQWWLPFVVYAAESGYEYAGGEYWQTFEESTPWWREYGDRDRIREWFQSVRGQVRRRRAAGRLRGVLHDHRLADHSCCAPGVPAA